MVGLLRKQKERWSEMNPQDLTPAERQANERSHFIGVVDDCYRCIYCEIGSWNAWKENCNAQ
jgi:hypothetical protein